MILKVIPLEIQDLFLGHLDVSSLKKNNLSCENLICMGYNGPQLRIIGCFKELVIRKKRNKCFFFLKKKRKKK